MNLFNIERTFRDKKNRNWDRIYICVDLHDVVIEGKFNKFNIGAEFFPGAVDVLRQFSYRKDIVLILWTSSHDDSVAAIMKKMEDNGIEFRYVNVNPECPNTELCDFSKKLYFNILLDDKAGFEGKTDWALIESEFRRLGEWDTK
jgi:hypothetical protein